MNRKLFVSFTALLRYMRDDKVTEKDLERGLFYFGCTRDHAFNPGHSGESNELPWIFKDPTEAQATHQVLLKYVEKAEKEGRCIWREPHEMNTYEQLNALLVKHGYSHDRAGGPAILWEPDNRTENPWYAYCYPGVRDRVAEVQLALDVVF